MEKKENNIIKMPVLENEVEEYLFFREEHKFIEELEEEVTENEMSELTEEAKAILEDIVAIGEEYRSRRRVPDKKRLELFGMMKEAAICIAEACSLDCKINVFQHGLAFIEFWSEEFIIIEDMPKKIKQLYGAMIGGSTSVCICPCSKKALEEKYPDIIAKNPDFNMIHIILEYKLCED